MCWETKTQVWPKPRVHPVCCLGNWNTISSDYIYCCRKLIALAILSPTATAWSRKRFCVWCVNMCQHNWTPLNTSCGYSTRVTWFFEFTFCNILLHTQDYTQDRKSKGRPSHQYHQCQARQQQTPNPRKPQENHKKPSRNQKIFGASLEHGTSLCFSKLRWIALDISGLGRPVHPRLPKQPQPLWAPWNILEHWNATMSWVCFWLFLSVATCFNTKNWTEIATIRNPLTLTYRSNRSNRSTYHNISQHITT